MRSPPPNNNLVHNTLSHVGQHRPLSLHPSLRVELDSIRPPPSCHILLAIMSSLKWKVSLLMACIVSTGSLAFHHPNPRCQLRNLSRQCGISRRRRINTTTAMNSNIATEADAIIPKRDGKNPSGACYYRRIDGSWKPRKELNKLFIGERLFATRFPER